MDSGPCIIVIRLLATDLQGFLHLALNTSDLVLVGVILKSISSFCQSLKFEH